MFDNTKSEGFRMQAKAANVKSALDMAANLILEETKVGNLKGFTPEQVVARFDNYADLFFKNISTRQETLLREVETAARS